MGESIDFWKEVAELKGSMRLFNEKLKIIEKDIEELKGRI